MRHLFLTTLFLLITLTPLRAERIEYNHCVQAYGSLHAGAPDTIILSRNNIFLNLHGGIGYGLYRDLGVSPLTYRGLQIYPSISVGLQKSYWRYEAMFSVAGGVYGLRLGTDYIQAYGGHPVLGVKALRLLLVGNHFSLWAGGLADNLFDIRYNASFGNANVGFSNFARLNLEGRAEYRLRNFLFHINLQINALSLLYRPGFAYMDNYDQDISSPVINTFDQYRCYLAIVTGAAPDLGATLLLSNGNRVGLSYQWNYLTSRTTTLAPHLFQYADHALLFHLGVRLN